MQQLRLRNITPDPVKSEEDRVSCTPKKKYGSFCGRTCVVLATAGITAIPADHVSVAK